MPLAYYRRIFAAYLGRGNSQLSFWHGAPVINEAAFGEDPHQYFMPFHSKAHYRGSVDADGLPRLDYRGEIGLQYNPIAISQWGLGAWNLWRTTKQRSWLAQAALAGDWLVDNLTPNDAGVPVWMHHFDWEYFQTLRGPWYSGLAQGQGISLLARLSSVPEREELHGLRPRCVYHQAAADAFISLRTPVDRGGVLFTDDKGDPWIEEYITQPPTHILNGFLWALWGVHDIAEGAWDEAAEARDLWSACLGTLERNLDRFDMGYWSCYDVAPVGRPNPASPFYHQLHLVQLEVMHRLTDRPCFRDTAQRWQAYADSPIGRRRAFLAKSIFKLRHY